MDAKEDATTAHLCLVQVGGEDAKKEDDPDPTRTGNPAPSARARLLPSQIVTHEWRIGPVPTPLDVGGWRATA